MMKAGGALRMQVLDPTHRCCEAGFLEPCCLQLEQPRQPDKQDSEFSFPRIRLSNGVCADNLSN